MVEAARVAFQAVRTHRLRSALCVVEVAIGVLAVVLLVAIGQGARVDVTRTIESLGSNLLLVFPGQSDLGTASTRSKFTLRDVERVGQALGDPSRVAADIVSRELVRARGRTSHASVLGITETFHNVIAHHLSRGEYFSASDVASGRRFALLGDTVAAELFPGRDAVGESVTIAGLKFHVVGVLSQLGGVVGPDRDTHVYIPISAAQRMYGEHVDGIFVRARSHEEIDDDAETVRSVLERRLGEDEFTVISQKDLIGVVKRVLELLTLLLAGIAGVSLLVGGVGVSNIMLVGVSERTHEIGLRKALGARTRDIMLQFLTEAIVLTGVGGVSGVVLGIGTALVVNRYSPLPAVITAWSVALALGVSVTVGVIFGVWPARRAGRLDPVVALRHG